MEWVKNAVSKRARPFSTTTTITETSGISASRNATVTRIVTEPVGGLAPALHTREIA